MSELSKIVLNKCFGGFNLSDEAKRAYLRRVGKSWTEGESEFRSLGIVFTVEGESYWSERDLDRADPDLVAVVEEMGSDANGLCAQLEIVTLPKGTHYLIDEYDGMETIRERDMTDWRVA